MIKNQLKKNNMKKKLLIIVFFIAFLIYEFSYIYCEFCPCGHSTNKNGSIVVLMDKVGTSIVGYEYYRHKYPENGKELLDFYYHNLKEKDLLKDYDYQGFKSKMDSFREHGRASFGKSVRIIRLKEKPKSRLTDINVEVPFVAYYIDKKPKLYDHDLFIYGCWRRDEKSNKCILISNAFKD